MLNMFNGITQFIGDASDAISGVFSNMDTNPELTAQAAGEYVETVVCGAASIGAGVPVGLAIAGGTGGVGAAAGLGAGMALGSTVYKRCKGTGLNEVISRGLTGANRM